LQVFDQTVKYRESDSLIRHLIRVNPLNREFHAIFIKTCVINDLYKTRIFASYEMAKHIFEKKIDPALESGDLGLVALISEAPFADRSFYSFATKYCSWHREAFYPIYDAIVENMFWRYKQQFAFCAFRTDAFRQYACYRGIVDAFISHFRLKEFTYKQIDCFLWTYGKKVVEQEADA